MFSKKFTRLGGLILALCLCVGLCAPAMAQEQTYIGMLSHGFEEKAAVYEGGQLELTYKIHSSGNVLEAGFGLGLLLDGVPQPFKTSDQGELACFHTIDLDGENAADVELIFTPVTGKTGEKLELAVYGVTGPAYFAGDPEMGPFQSDYSLFNFLQLDFQADPEPSQGNFEPGKVSVEKGPTSEMGVLAVEGGKVRTVTGEASLSWLLSAPAGKDYRVAVYVDHKPVSVMDVPTMQSGEQARLEVTLPELEGKHICYALAFDRNWKAQGGNPETVASETVYLNVT